MSNTEIRNSRTGQFDSKYKLLCGAHTNDACNRRRKEKGKGKIFLSPNRQPPLAALVNEALEERTAFLMGEDLVFTGSNDPRRRTRKYDLEEIFDSIREARESRAFRRARITEEGCFIMR